MMKNFSGKSGIGRLLVIFAVFFAYAGLTSANPIQFSNVDFQNGQGTLSGYFQTNGSLQVTSWNLHTSTFDCNPCGLSHGFPGINYTESTSTAVINYLNGYQSITFISSVNNVDWGLDFVLNCGGGGKDCIANATLGSKIAVSSAFEMNLIDFLPYRALTLASLDVTDPPIGLSFNVVPSSTSIPEPPTLLLFVPVLAALVGLRRKSTVLNVCSR
jgi:hypothetical protein